MGNLRILPYGRVQPCIQVPSLVLLYVPVHTLSNLPIIVRWLLVGGREAQIGVFRWNDHP
jgi:hypothetical protein